MFNSNLSTTNNRLKGSYASLGRICRPQPADAVVVPNQEQHVRSTAPEATYPASTNYLVSSSFTGMNNGQEASSDPGLYYSNHIHGQQHNLSNLVRSQVSVNNPVWLQQVIQPVSNNLHQQVFCPPIQC